MLMIGETSIYLRRYEAHEAWSALYAIPLAGFANCHLIF